MRKNMREPDRIEIAPKPHKVRAPSAAKLLAAGARQFFEGSKRRTGVWDTETTGLLKPGISDINQQPQIIELAIVVLDDDYKRLSEHSWLINPGRPAVSTGTSSRDSKPRSPRRGHARHSCGR